VTRAKFLLLIATIALGLAGWGFGIAWGFGQPGTRGASSWQALVIVMGPMLLALLSMPLYWGIQLMVGTYGSLPTGREKRLADARRKATEAEAEIARLEREAGIR